MPSKEVLKELEELKQELEKASTAIKHIDEAAKVVDQFSKIIKEIEDLYKELNKIEKDHRDILLKEHKNRINEFEKQLKKPIENLNLVLQQFINLSNEINETKIQIGNYYTKIEKINFPERLDKIDNQISAINIGIANLQSAIQNTQSKSDIIKSDINNLNLLNEKRFNDIENKIFNQNELLKKETKKNRIILLIGFSVILIILIYLIIK